MASEKFCLRWNDFETNISTAFRELRDDKDFFDVTLACNGDQIQAHKVILSACSPFFRNILRRNPHQHPLLYLKGVKYSDLQSVLNFMYHGEVNVAQEELNSFLAVAEELSVKGLTQNQPSAPNNKSESYSKPQLKPPSTSNPPERDQHTSSAKKPRLIPSAAATSNNQRIGDEDIQEVVPVKSEPRDPPNPSQSLAPTPHHPIYPPAQQQGHVLAQADDDQALAYPDDSYEDYGQYGDEQDYQSGMAGMSGMGNQPGVTGAVGAEGYVFQDPSELLQFVRKDLYDGKFHCTVCGKFSHKIGACTRNHVESQHFPNMFTYPCDQCDMTFGTKTTFNLHRSRKHNPKNR